ncbi:hypothetical protein Ga0080574_TMP2469 [Salipiger abyssi]|uniref:Uncharacterized protein n=1 Tax=Salipiger abyssi TaxID=1250539 RepID=A0A1P8UTT2_9RHOB|nr:hypothetical protein Ga0080574_TMP2469 [Salipiger abyssi]
MTARVRKSQGCVDGLFQGVRERRHGGAPLVCGRAGMPNFASYG